MENKRRILIIVGIIVSVIVLLLVIFGIIKKINKDTYIGNTQVCRNVIDDGQGVDIFDELDKKDKFIAYLWKKYKDDYTSTKYIEYPGDPIQIDLISFEKDKIKLCVLINRDEEGYECSYYKYSIDDKKLVITYNNEKITYSYSFDKQGLVLTLNGDGYVSNFYYERNEMRLCDYK